MKKHQGKDVESENKEIKEQYEKRLINKI